MNRFLSEIHERYTKIVKNANLIGFWTDWLFLTLLLYLAKTLTNSQSLDKFLWNFCLHLFQFNNKHGLKKSMTCLVLFLLLYKDRYSTKSLWLDHHLNWLLCKWLLLNTLISMNHMCSENGMWGLWFGIELWQFRWICSDSILLLSRCNSFFRKIISMKSMLKCEKIKFCLSTHFSN